MRRLFKPLALLLLQALEQLSDFETSPLPQVAERLKMILGRYEIGTTRFIKKNLRGGVAFDIGANVGYYARLMARHASHVYAFEPDPDNFALLMKNCKRYPAITPLNMAASDRMGVADFFKVKGSAMRHSLIDEGGTQKITVATTTLDAFISERGITGVSMVKIDAEGAEPMIFEGMQELIEREHPVIIYEGYDSSAQAIGPSGDLVDAARASRLGAKQKVINMVLR